MNLQSMNDLYPQEVMSGFENKHEIFCLVKKDSAGDDLYFAINMKDAFEEYCTGIYSSVYHFNQATKSWKQFGN